MRLPPLRLLRWPLRAGLASGLASLLTLARGSVLDRYSTRGENVIPAPVFATVTAIVCVGATRGASIQASWAVVGGTAMGSLLSALALALLGSSLVAVLVSNSLIGLLVLYPRQFPVLAQKFAFGGSTIVLWGVYSDGLSPRWNPIGLPLSAAAGAICALLVRRNDEHRGGRGEGGVRASRGVGEGVSGRISRTIASSLFRSSGRQNLFPSDLCIFNLTLVLVIPCSTLRTRLFVCFCGRRPTPRRDTMTCTNRKDTCSERRHGAVAAAPSPPVTGLTINLAEKK